MKKKLYILILIGILSIGFSDLVAQNDKPIDLTTEELESYNEQLSNLVSYLEGTLNFLGDPQSSPREKEIVVNSSYLKMFESDKVQIEDDLDDNRDVPLHKDVQAYLKDISFFYRKVSFKFIILEINHFINEKNQHYFKITFNRDMEGVTIAGDSVLSRKLRYMEVNLDMARSDLRIASIYTTRLNAREESRNWWNDLPEAWRRVFGSQVQVCDSLLLSEIQYIGDSLILYKKVQPLDEVDTLALYEIDLPEERQTALYSGSLDTLYCETKEVFIKLSGIQKQKQLDVSGNEELRSLDPLVALSDLEELNCSNTIITSLFPLRNLNKLKQLDFSNTPVESLSALYYSTSIEELNCSFTLITDMGFVVNLFRLKQINISGLRLDDLSFVQEMEQIELLNASETSITHLDPLEGLVYLENLDISDTWVQDLKALKGHDKLQILNCDRTPIRSIEPLAGLPALQYLKISYTPVETIEPLITNEKLTRIYWDSDPVYNVDLNLKKEAAIRFMKERPECLVIFESEELIEGWKVLDPAWKEIATKAAGISDDPGKEELHSLLKIEEINLEGTSVTTLDPVRRLYNLKRLHAPGINVENYQPVGEALELKYLNLNSTSINDLGFTIKLHQLQELHITNTDISTLNPLIEITSLKYIYAESSKITVEEAFRFRGANPGCTVIFMGDSLHSWWDQLPEAWKNWFTSGYSLDSPPSNEQLHALMYTKKIVLEDFPETLSLTPLLIMHGLVELKISGSVLEDAGLLERFPKLTHLSLTGMPLSDLPISRSLQKLESLDLENTSVSKLKFLELLPGLTSLNISGTQVKSLSLVASLQSLEEIEFNNTAIKNIRPLEGLHNLNSVYCFNTRISAKNIEKFKKLKPACKVVYY